MTGGRILIVEDEFLIAVEIKRVLTEAGWIVVGPAGTCEHALRLAGEAALDGALLDAHLDGERTDEVARMLEQRAVPYVWVTGSGRESLPVASRDNAVLGKPFNSIELLSAVDRLMI